MIYANYEHDFLVFKIIAMLVYKLLFKRVAQEIPQPVLQSHFNRIKNGVSGNCCADSLIDLTKIRNGTTPGDKYTVEETKIFKFAVFKSLLAHQVILSSF